MDVYEQVLPETFGWVVRGQSPETVRRLATYLLEPRPDFALGGSSFAVTTRPYGYTLWLSRASTVVLERTMPPAEFRELVRPIKDEVE